MDAAGLDAFDWLIWRPATSPLIKDDLWTIKKRWSLLDLAEAHIALDVSYALEPDPFQPKTK